MKKNFETRAGKQSLMTNEGEERCQVDISQLSSYAYLTVCDCH